MKILYFLLLPIFLTNNSHAETLRNTTFGTLTIKEVTSIYDGDTFRVNIDGVHPIIGNRVPIRIKDIDTPELRGKCQKEINLAKQAKQYTVNQLRSGHHIQLTNDRHGSSSTVIISQLPTEDWHHSIGDNTLADAILSLSLYLKLLVAIDAQPVVKKARTIKITFFIIYIPLV